MGRIRIEHKDHNYNCGKIFRDWDSPISKEMPSSDFADMLEKVDVRLYHHWADGNNIFHLTERQFNKLAKIISESEYKI